MTTAVSVDFLLLALRLFLLLVLLRLLLLLLFEQLLQLFQFLVVRIKFQAAFHFFQRRRNVVGNIKLRAAVEKIIGGRELRAGVLP